MKLHCILCGAGALAAVSTSMAQTPVIVTTDITTNTTWVSTNTYILQGSVSNQGVIRVLPGVTLTINPGTVIRGQPRQSSTEYNAGSLAVLRGGRIIADGTPTNPIIFTTAAVDANADGVPDGFVRNGNPGEIGSYTLAERFDPSNPKQFWDANPLTAPKTSTMTGLWGGVIVLGSAPVNYAVDGDTPNATTGNGLNSRANVSSDLNTHYRYTLPVIEGLVSPDYQYGAGWAASDVLPPGTPSSYVRTRNVDPDDDSGIIRYVSIRHGGVQLSLDNEINGLTLGGVGRGTKIQYVEVYGNEDDGVEVFGGTVNLSHIVISATKDDGLDLDQGYSGQIQFVLVIGGSYVDRLGELDGDDAFSDNPNTRSMANYGPRGSYEIRNATFIAGPSLNPSTSKNRVTLRNNASAKLYNCLFQNYGSGTALEVTSNFWNRVESITLNAGSTSFATNTVSANIINPGNAGFGTITFAVEALPGDTPGLQAITALNPRPLNTGGSVPAVLSNVYPVPLGNRTFFQNVAYRGAFSNNALVPLWTNGWTALNRRGVIPTL